MLLKPPGSPGYASLDEPPAMRRGETGVPQSARMPPGFGLQLVLAIAGLVLGMVALATPGMVRLPAEFLACLVGPWVLYFRSFARILHLPVRVGVSLIAVIASWTGVSTIIFALGLGLSEGPAVTILVAVYLLGVSAFLMLRANYDKGSPPDGGLSPDHVVQSPFNS